MIIGIGGYQLGRRIRDNKIETDKNFALGLLQEITRQIGKENKLLHLLTYYDEFQVEPDKISTNYYREIAYNLEHTIHHMALIRIGIHEVSAIQLPDNYGVASSTIRHRQSTCAQ